jgi:hypothetical protein
MAARQKAAAIFFRKKNTMSHTCYSILRNQAAPAPAKPAAAPAPGKTKPAPGKKTKRAKRK